MIVFIAHNLAPIMFAALVVFLLLGYPVAFALAANGLLFFVIAVELAPYASGEISLSWPLLQALPERVFGIMNNDTLLAVPFFTFMGLILERSGMAEDLLDTIGQLFGPIRGGLAYAVIFVGALLAATTGVVAASVISMGLISLPIMLRYGYDRSIAAGTIAASGTLAQIIPPSLVLIVLADQLGRSVGDMYAGALFPGLVLTALYAGWILLVSLVAPHRVPALPLEARQLGSGVTSLIMALAAGVAVGFLAKELFPLLGEDSALFRRLANGGVVAYGAAAVAFVYLLALSNRWFSLGLLSRLAEKVIIVLIPPLALIFLVLGTIFIGIATPTEGGAMGAVGALFLALANRRLSLPLMRQAMDTTAKLTCFVVFILIGARVFSLTFYGVNGHVWVEELLTSLPGGQTGFLIVVNVMVFLLAFFLDFFELAFIVVPLLAPAAASLGIDLIWFGVLLGVNMQTSFMHPPFGFALFYLRSVAANEDYTDKITGERIARVKTSQIYYGAVPYVVVQCIMIGIVIAVPWLVLHFKAGRQVVDPSTIKIEIPTFDPGGPGIPGPPSFDQPIEIPPPPSFDQPIQIPPPVR